jgi:hypothetical protein
MQLLNKFEMSEQVFRLLVLDENFRLTTLAKQEGRDELVLVKQFQFQKDINTKNLI